MMNKTKTKMTLMARAFGLLLMLVAGTMAGYAQNNVEYFTYEDQGKTIIDGLTLDYGQRAEDLTIPATVTTVRSGAFSNARNDNKPLTSLTIDGGNPSFEGSLFGRTSTLTEINMGGRMSVANMEALLNSIGANSPLETIDIEGYTGTSESWKKLKWEYEEDENHIYILTEHVDIRIPAKLITDDQVFGKAKVYGHFPINKELITYCGSATFVDVDNGSNMLFYVADEEEGDDHNYIHIQRVRYLVPGKGVLIHRTNSSCGYANLQRSDYPFSDLIKDEKNTQAIGDNVLYEKNLLVGVTSATGITSTVTTNDVEYTNLILKDGAFYRTSDGTIGANKAYLQIPTSWLSSISGTRLEISFPDEETGIGSLTTNPSPNDGEWYDLSGRRLSGKPSTKGIYMNNGKKYVIK